MQKVIEKYIYAVTKRCPAAQRDEIKKELASNIYDMLGNNSHPSDKEIDDVLHKIGNPIYVAAKYQTEEKYVVPPVFYQDYIQILKGTLIGFGILGLLVGSIQGFTTPLANSGPIAVIGFIFGQTVENITSFLLSGFAIVTLAFWSYNVPSIKERVDHWLANWKVSDLLDVPSDNKKDKLVGRINIFFEMFFTLLFSVAFSVFFIFYFDQIGFYVDGALVAQMLNPEIKELFAFLILIGLISTFFFYLYYLKEGKKSLGVVIYTTLNGFYSLIVTLVFVTYPNIVLPSFIEYIADYFSFSVLDVTRWFEYAFIIIIVIALLSFIIEQLVLWIKYAYQKRKN